MKSNKLIILFIFVFSTVFSQKTDSTIVVDSTTVTKDSIITKANYNGWPLHYNKWSVDIGAGISNGTRPYTDGYYTRIENQLFDNFTINCYTVGVRYNFSQIIGLKADVSFDRFTNSDDNSSKPFETAQYRASIQAVVNLNNLIFENNFPTRFNVLLHAGLNMAILYPITSDYNPKVGDPDNYGGFVFGITPTLRIYKKMSLFLDLSSFSNYGQNLTWNGKHSAGNNNTDGHMIAGTFGLSFDLDNNKKQNASTYGYANKPVRSDVVNVKPVDMVINDQTKTEANIAPVLVPAPTTTIKTTREGISAISPEQAKKLINDGYIAVYFNLGDAKPAASNSNEGIGFVLTYLRNNPTATVDIIGSADQTGTVAMNEKLATARAQNIKDILTKARVSPSRMKIISGGEDNSVDVNSVEARSLVRKVVFKIK